MCGIFGYIGNREMKEVLLDGLTTLEYRGYDSAGIYIPEHGVIRSLGRIDALKEKAKNMEGGQMGIAHTRWATHGEPSEQNAHPHSSGKIRMVHNGIIENYKELRDNLPCKGSCLQSETDSEVLTHLISNFYTDSLEEAVINALKEVRGAYGIAVVADDNPKEIVVARMGSPIVLGIGEDEYFVSSDPSALLSYTKRVLYLDDGDMAVLDRKGYRVSDKKKTPEHVSWDQEVAQKEGYEHFMLKEMHEAPEVVRNALRGRLRADTAHLGGLGEYLDEISKAKRIHIVGCGTAYYAGLIGKNMLEQYANIPVSIELASEYRYKTHPPEEGGILFAVSQSGETADTLASVRSAKERGLRTFGIVNVVGSTIARETDAGVYNHAGPEVAVASTKAFVSTVVVFALLALYLGRSRGMSAEEGKGITQALKELPDILERMLRDTRDVERLARVYASYDDMMFIGRTGHHPVALEGALKLKEVAYIHAEAYAGGELKHGPLALMDTKFPVLALAPKGEMYEKMISNIEEVRARKAPVIVVAEEGDTKIQDVADDVLFVPRVHPMLQPLASTIPLHFFAYYVGVEKGLDVDKPRNLAKSVTVE